MCNYGCEVHVFVHVSVNACVCLRACVCVCVCAAATKTVLIVLAHQSPGSFNAAVCDVAVQELRLQGFRVLLSDLYAMKFRADATRDDIIGELKKPELFQYGDETMSAWKEDRLSNDIVAEQRKVEEADLIIFQFPLYWFSVPAILKGWFDRVFTQGFAFSLENMYDNGVFKDKKAMLSFTTGAIQTMFHSRHQRGHQRHPLAHTEWHAALLWIPGSCPQIFCPPHAPPCWMGGGRG
uniref:N-ribosyldihydronicotinamide:quinone dehydrogenase 2 n=1 Tax=Tetraodon nigroviridis TaxID=99883 RepID=H3C929_TETNG